MEGNITVKVQAKGMVAIHQEGSTVTNHPLKMRGFLQDLGLAKRRAMQLKPKKIRFHELSSQSEKLYTEALVEVLGKAIAEKIRVASKNECMVCCEQAMQIHSCYLSNLREEVDRNFDKAFRLVDLWLANKTPFE